MNRPVPNPPRALARLQFHAGFTLDDAAGLVDYYAALGVSHLYASPLLRARPGSSHGYDVIDPHQLNPELGGEPALRRLVERLRAHGMGLVLDIVPNHMFAGAGNAWWMDVLRHGRGSRYAGYFDIDWSHPDPLVRGRVLLPVLGTPYAEALAGGDLRLVFDGEADAFAVALYEQRLPLAPADALALAGAGPVEAVLAAHDRSTDAGRARLHDLLERQHYRLVLWKLASDSINYRRFFDINELAGLRQERTRVFEDSHALIFRLYAEGLIDGLRVDHVDGLADPHRYCRQLRHRLRRLQPRRPPDAAQGPAYLVVEKILAEGESLRPDWHVDGTTGYEFMDQVSALLHDADGAELLTALWQAISRDGRDFPALAHAARRQILVDSFEAELDRTARTLLAAARAHLETRDVSQAAIRRVLVELLVHFPVYRTYAGGLGRSAEDETAFARAYAGALRSVRMEDRDLLRAMLVWLGGEPPRALPPGTVRQARSRALAIFQQATSPMAAKAVEDTACYRYGRLLSRNEVGADPGRLAIGVPAFHAACLERARHFPNNLLATATHDHKRGEDVRARLATLSEPSVAALWTDAVNRWRVRHEAWRGDTEGVRAPGGADAYMLYQTLFGAWPPDLAPDDTQGVATLAERVAQWQRKALREAKQRTRWTRPNEPYEDACEAFLYRLLQPGDRFLVELHALVRQVAAPAAANSLAQTVLKLTTPGIPDIYQGTELWDFSLVDPDNRRPVDFAQRRRSLEAAAAPGLAPWRDGRLKQQVIARLLDLRRRHPLLFAIGSYRPLVVRTDHPGGAERLLAFERRHGGSSVVVLALRHGAPALFDADTLGADIGRLLGEDAFVHGTGSGQGRNVLDGREGDLGEPLRPAAWLARLPVAVIERLG